MLDLVIAFLLAAVFYYYYYYYFVRHFLFFLIPYSCMEGTGFEPCNDTLFWSHFGCIYLLYVYIGDWPAKACIKRSMLISASVYHPCECYKTYFVTS